MEVVVTRTTSVRRAQPGLLTCTDHKYLLDIMPQVEAL
jgi:hypothetical protein